MASSDQCISPCVIVLEPYRRRMAVTDKVKGRRRWEMHVHMGSIRDCF